MPEFGVDIVDGSGPRYTSSAATRDRRKSKRKKKGGRRGHPSSFSEGRLALFAEYQSEFNKIAKKARTQQKAFWAGFFKVYWPQFPYTVPLKDEPLESTWPLPDEEAFTDQQRKEKGKAVANVILAIKRHFRYVCDRLKNGGNPWAGALTELREDDAPAPVPPRQLAPWQLYMSREMENIERVVEERRITERTPASHIVALRGLVARELLAKETKEYRQALLAECADMLDAARTAYDAVPAPTPISSLSQAEARDKLTVVAQPLLNLIREHTGFYVTLIAGYPLTTRNLVTIVNAGTTDGPVPVPWHLHDPGRFAKDVMPTFANFLAHTAEGLSRGGPAASMQPAHTSFVSIPLQPAASSSSDMAHPLPHVPTLRQPPNVGAETTRKQPVEDCHPNGGVRKSGLEGCGEDGNDVRDQWVPDEEDDDKDNGDERDEDGDEDEDKDEDKDKDKDKDKDEDEEDELARDRSSVSAPTAVTRHTPDPDALRLNDAVNRQLTLLSPKTRRTELLRLARYSTWDRETLCARVGAAEMLAEMSNTTVDIPLEMNAPDAVRAAIKASESPTKGKGKGKAASSAAPTSAAIGPRRTSARVAKGGHNALQDSGSIPIEASHSPGEPLSEPLPPPSSALQSFNEPPSPTPPSIHIPDECLTHNDAPQPLPPSIVGEPNERPPLMLTTPTAPLIVDKPIMHLASAEPPLILQSQPLPTVCEPDAPPVSAEPPQQQPPLPPSVDRCDPSPPSTKRVRAVLLLDDSGWPTWVQDAFDYLEDKAYGDDFARAAEWWTVIERQYGWQTSAKGLGTEHRPPEVSHWLRVLRRNLLRPPPIACEAEYCSFWWRWWSGLQPLWRDRTEDGRLAITGPGEWDSLECPGKNGLLIVLLSLAWWRDVATDITLDDWHAAAADVSWVAESMAQQLLEQQGNLQTESPNSPERWKEPPRKKQRRV